MLRERNNTQKKDSQLKTNDETVRVLQVLPGGPSQGGIESFVMNYYRNMNRDSIQFDFLVHYKSSKWFCEEEILDLGGRVHYLSAREDKNMIKYIRDLSKILRIHPEYRIMHGHMPGFAPVYFKVAECLGVPIRISHSHVSATEPTAKGAMLEKVIHAIPKTANVYWACSKLAGEFMYGPHRQFDVIPNAISLERFKPDKTTRRALRQELGVGEKILIGHVGRLCPQKNQLFLLDVFAEMLAMNQNVVLLIIGEGEMRSEIETKISDLRLGNSVHLLSNQTDIEKYYQAMDVCVLPSLFEGLCITAVEAQACGVPCVVSSNLSEETLLTPTIATVDLDASVSKWAQSILSMSLKGISDNRQLVSSAGYDIKAASNDLQEKYCKLYTRACENGDR